MYLCLWSNGHISRRTLVRFPLMLGLVFGYLSKVKPNKSVENVSSFRSRDRAKKKGKYGIDVQYHLSNWDRCGTMDTITRVFNPVHRRRCHDGPFKTIGHLMHPTYLPFLGPPPRTLSPPLLPSPAAEHHDPPLGPCATTFKSVSSRPARFYRRITRRYLG